MFVDIVKVFII